MADNANPKKEYKITIEVRDASLEPGEPRYYCGADMYIESSKDIIDVYMEYADRIGIKTI